MITIRIIITITIIITIITRMTAHNAIAYNV